MSSILVFTGEGKGKTSAAVGTMIRSLGRGKNVAIVQFHKDSKWFASSEIEFLKKNTTAQIFQFGRKGWVNPNAPSDEDHKLGQQAFSKCMDLIEEKPFLLVTDEILPALLFETVSEADVLALVAASRHNKVNLILTGRGITENIIESADIVTEMQIIKHHYQAGVKAIEGIDY